MVRYFWETTKHRFWVLWYTMRFVRALLFRAVVHDLSKYQEPEASLFAAALSELSATEYGSSEYMQMLQRLEPALDHHYAVNSHHPEYWLGGISAMSPLDLVEMLADWKAAVRRHNNGSFSTSFDTNVERFYIYGNPRHALWRAAAEAGLFDESNH